MVSESEDLDIRAATAADLPAIEALLEAAALPVEGISALVGQFVVALDGDGRPVGAACLEPLLPALGLLRSVIVAPHARERGLGRRLYAAVRKRAAAMQLESLYLLTTDGEPYFRRLGFERIERAHAPAPVQQSEQFRSLCPASAVVMHCALA